MNENARRGGRWLFGLLVMLSPVLLLAPSLQNGWYADDYIHRARLLPGPTLPSSLEHPCEWERGSVLCAAMHLFVFVDDSPGRLETMTQAGVLPWWRAESLQMAFWRPLSGLTHWLDYQLWPDAPLAMHAHNLLWVMAAVAAAGFTLRGLIDDAVAWRVAWLLYALHEGLGAAAWIAARNSYISACLGFLALGFLLRWAKGKGRFNQVGFAIALLACWLSAEAGIAVLGYVVAYVLLTRDREKHCRWRPLLIAAVALMAWQAVYRMMGYGAQATSLYTEPFTAPWQSLQALAIHYLPLMGKLTLTSALLPMPFVMAGVGALVGVAAWPVLRRNWTMRFGLLGSALALVPACWHGWPLEENRLLALPALGWCTVLAVWCVAEWRANRGQAEGLLKGAGVRLMVAGLATLGTAGMGGWQIWNHATDIQHEQRELEASITFPAIRQTEESSWLLLSAPSSAWHFFSAYVNAYTGEAVTNRALILTTSHAGQLGRVDESEWRLSSQQGILGKRGDWIWRDPSRSFAIGEEYRLGRWLVVIEALTPDGIPKQVRLITKGSADETNSRFARWRLGRYEAIEELPIGETTGW